MHPTVLYVEDDPNDVLLMRHAWTKVGIPNPLQVVSDGAEAVRYLSGEGRYANRVEYPIPVLVLLDLKMPRMTGLDVLRWIRSHPALRVLPVIVFSSSRQPKDINSAHTLRIDAYLVKPGRLDEWVATIDNLAKHWLRGEEG
jgi:CheY-like chemotaxis protein